MASGWNKHVIVFVQIAFYVGPFTIVIFGPRFLIVFQARIALCIKSAKPQFSKSFLIVVTPSPNVLILTILKGHKLLGNGGNGGNNKLLGI